MDLDTSFVVEMRMAFDFFFADAEKISSVSGRRNLPNFHFFPLIIIYTPSKAQYKLSSGTS